MSARALRPRTWSFVVPYYNEERYLERTLRSLLAQTRPPDVFILVNNASTDRSADIARGVMACARAEVIHLDDARPGKVNALESACRALETELAAFGDADTFYPRSYVEGLDRHFVARPDASCVLSFGLSPDMTAEARRRVLKARARRAGRLSKCCTGGFGHAYRTACLLSAGGFSEERWPFILEDHEIIHRMTRQGRIVHADDVWCEPSSRRFDRRDVSWGLFDRNLYLSLPGFLMDAYFYRYLWGRLARAKRYSARLRTRPWEIDAKAPCSLRAISEPKIPPRRETRSG